MQILENGKVVHAQHDHLRNSDKMHLLDLPVIHRHLTSWHYKRNNACETAIVYPLFFTKETVYPFGIAYVKGALYSALSLIKKTDIAEAGIPIFFNVSEKDIDRIAPYFHAAGVPEAWIRTWKPKLYTLFDKFLAVDIMAHKRVFMWDADIFARGKTRPIAHELQWDIEQQDIAAAYLTKGQQPLLGFKFRIDEAATNAKHAQQFLKHNAQETIKSWYTSQENYYINTALIGFSKQFRGNTQWCAFQESCRAYATEINSTISDEDVLIIYIQENPEIVPRIKTLALEYSISMPHLDIPFNTPALHLHHIHNAHGYPHWRTDWLAEMEDLL